MNKYLIIFILGIRFSYGQHELVLKNGGSIDGKLIEVKKDTILFNFQNNIVKFHLNQLISINFEKIVLNSNFTHERTISGVVTYFHNKYQDNKPDTGSEIFLADSSLIQNFNQEAVDLFKRVSYTKSIYLNYKSSSIDVPKNILEDVKKYNLDDKSTFDSVDKKCVDNILKIQYAKNIIKSAVDATGSFSAKIPNGTYYLLIRSKNRDGLSMSEITGKFYFEKITIINKDKSINVKFSL